MQKFSSADEVLDFAIEQEIAAQNFYHHLAVNSDIPEMKAVFKSFAKEEKGHQSKLESMKTKGSFAAASNAADVKDLGLADYLIDVEPMPHMEYKDALVLAMKKEKAAYRLYSDLAELSKSNEMRDAFLFLAQEEAKHKLRFEIEYDDIILHED
jgi:rubrerythrin